MGSYCTLEFDGLHVIGSKSYVPDGMISMFQELDRQVITKAVGEQDEEPEITYRYTALRKIILARLDILGITSDRAESAFESWRRAEIEAYTEYGEDFEETLEAITSLSFAEWEKRVPTVLQNQFKERDNDFGDEIEKQMFERDDGWLFFEAADERLMLRAILDASANVKSVSIDITDLVVGGWLEPDTKLCAAARSPENITRPMHEPIVILGEGSTDVLLRTSLPVLFPHLVEYFAFFDHTELNVDGGANYLVKFLQAFSAARISSRMVAIFDNDTVGREAYEKAKALRLPRNITVLKLPDIEIGRAYPTVGPQGSQIVDVSGRAASIELYLGRRNLLLASRKLSPVRWRGYSDRMKAYQGEIEGKSEILKRFDRDSIYLRKNTNLS